MFRSTTEAEGVLAWTVTVVAAAEAAADADDAAGEVEIGEESGDAAADPRVAASATGRIGERVPAFPAPMSIPLAAVP